MQIKDVTLQAEWDAFAQNYRPSSMLQSWAWGEFNHQQGNRVYRLGLYDGSTLTSAALGVVVRAKRGTYLTVQGGPMIDWLQADSLALWTDFFVTTAKNEHADFLRLQAPLLHSDENIQLLTSHGFRLAPMGMPAEHTLLLDLEQSEDQLLANMRKHTRYYVRRAEKEGVVIKISRETKDLEAFYELYRETVRRQRFVPYSHQYFENEVRAFAEFDLVDLVLGYDQGVLRSGAMIVYYGDTAYYHHGASLRDQGQESYASYAVQWHAMRQAKNRGMKWYDFWGVAPTDDQEHAKSGLTTFKRGFGGERVRRLHTMDYPLTWRYWPLWLYSRYEKMKRGW